jgi:hypothetical protein
MASSMLNIVPYNVTVPEFAPERKAPIFPQITRVYPCQEAVAGLVNHWKKLTWRIQQPDPSMVWTAVKLVMPLRMQCFGKGDSTTPLDMRVSSKLPAANIALAESPWDAFRQTSLSLNGRIFSEVNDYKRVLDCCYQGTGPASYGDNHSLKPVVIRDMVADAAFEEAIPIQTYNDRTGVWVNITSNGQPMSLNTDYVEQKVLDNAFSLLEHNGPFLERARVFQDELSADGKTWEGLVTSYLEVGPFQARGRKGNSAVPFIRDFHLMLSFVSNQSSFDGVLGIDPQTCLASNVVKARTVPGKLFEFATIPNIRHFGETVRVTKSFPCAFGCTWTRKPFLEVTYTKYLESMAPSYKLRCYERQFEQSNRFQLSPILALGKDTRGSEKQLARVTSRLLSYPTKIYLYGDLVRTDKDSFILGNVRRSCTLNNIHCRINQRPDVIFNPSQEECFEMFQRHTNSNLEFGAWKKSPIYVFTAVDLGQSDMFSNDARRAIFEWDAEVSLTALQCQEMSDSNNSQYLIAQGYASEGAEDRNWILPSGDFCEISWDTRAGSSSYTNGNSRPPLLLTDFRGAQDLRMSRGSGVCPFLGETLRWSSYLKFSPATGNYAVIDSPTTEDFVLTNTTSNTVSFRGCIWAYVKLSDGTITDGEIFWVPFSYEFIHPGNDEIVMNPWTYLTYAHAGTDNKGADVFIHSVRGEDVNSLMSFSGQYASGTYQNKWLNPSSSNASNGATAAMPGPFGFYMDLNGIRTAKSGGSEAYQWPGPLKSGTAPFSPQDARDITHRWLMFVPPTNAVNVGATGPYHQILRPLNTLDLTGGAARDVNMFPLYADQPANLFLGVGRNCAQCVHYKTVVNRNAGKHPKSTGTVNMNVQGSKVFGFPASHESDHIDKDAHFQYTMKALYEFGNSQYEFGQDGLPTKILPNLIPVDRSPNIPNLV